MSVRRPQSQPTYPWKKEKEKIVKDNTKEQISGRIFEIVSPDVLLHHDRCAGIKNHLYLIGLVKESEDGS